MKDGDTEACLTWRKYNMKTECLTCTWSHLSQAYFARTIVESTYIYRQSANHWTINQKTSQYCPSCALNSNVKQPRTAAHSSILASTNTFGGAPGVAGTLDLTTGKEGEVLAQTLSFCLQGHSCLIGGSHCLVWHEAVCVPDCHPAGGQASQLPCDGSFRQRVSTCHQPCTQSYHGGGLFCASRGKELQAKVRIQGVRAYRCILHISYTDTLKGWICLFSLGVCRMIDLNLSDIHRKEKSTKTDTTAADNKVSSSFDQKKMNDSYVSRV